MKHPSEDVSDDVVTAARAGEHHAWTEIDLHLRPALARYAASKGVRDPDDVAQEVMYTAFVHIDRIEGGWTDLRAWAFTVAFRRCADYHRRRYRRSESLMASVPESMSSEVGADDQLWGQLDGLEALNALSILSDRERAVLTMRVMDGLSTRIVADILGISRINVRVIQTRALSRMRTFLENNGGTLDKRFRLLPFPGFSFATKPLQAFLGKKGVDSMGGENAGMGVATGAGTTAQGTVSNGLASGAPSFLSTFAAGGTHLFAATVVAAGTSLAAVAPVFAEASTHSAPETSPTPAVAQVAEPRISNLPTPTEPQSDSISEPSDTAVSSTPPDTPSDTSGGNDQPDDDNTPNPQDTNANDAELAADDHTPETEDSDEGTDPGSVDDMVTPADVPNSPSSLGVDEIVGDLVDGVDGVVTELSEVPETVTETTRQLLEGTGEIVSETTSGLTDVVDSVTQQQLTEPLDEAAGLVEDTTGEVIDTAAEVTEVVDETVDTATDLVHALLGG